jgi:phenylalanyl-tRNA synthetase beta chain
MKLPLSLIQAFLDIEIAPAKIAEALTLAGIEVDNVEEGKDPIFEISLTPNLGHCMSALGIARELAAHLGCKMRPFKSVSLKASGQSVVHDGKFCPRYMTLSLEGIKKAPFRHAEQLTDCGQKAIHPIVDATNFVMMKLGQPLHAFDADKLEGPLQVALSKKEFSFLCLDGVERNVPAGTLVISDGKKPVAIAGVIGGMNSAVSEETTRVVLEAAQFDPLIVRTAAKALGSRTESAQRFEKGVDPLGLERALQEAAELIGGSIKGHTQTISVPYAPKKIAYRPERINRLLGTKLSETECEELFTRLELHPKQREVTVPSYRFDLNEEIDLVEEAARVYGYQNIEKHEPKITLGEAQNDPYFVFEKKMKSRLVELGLTEFLNCDLTSPKLSEVAEQIAPSLGILRAAYAKTEEYSVLRTSLLPALLQSARTNFDQQREEIAAFEVGRIHYLDQEKVVETPLCAILLSGKSHGPHWGGKSRPVDFFDLKGIVEALLPSQFRASSQLALHPGRQAEIVLDDLVVGSLGQVHPMLTAKFGIDAPIYYAELNLLSLMEKQKGLVRAKPLAQFPSSVRDWTVALPSHTPIETIFSKIYAGKSPLLEKAELIDLYQPDTQTKNATFRFVYRDPLKTVSFEEVEKEHSRLLNLLAK